MSRWLKWLESKVNQKTTKTWKIFLKFTPFSLKTSTRKTSLRPQ